MTPKVCESAVFQNSFKTDFLFITNQFFAIFIYKKWPFFIKTNFVTAMRQYSFKLFI